MLNVVIPAPSAALTTYKAVADELGDVGSLVETFIARASATIETHLQRRLPLERVRETLSLRRGGRAVLSRWPVVAVHSVTHDGRDVPYAIDPVGVLSGVSGDVAVEYTAGYILPGEAGRTLPYDIERVCIELVKFDWHTRNRDVSVRSEGVDGVSSLAFFGSGSTTNSILAPLAPYRQAVAA